MANQSQLRRLFKHGSEDFFKVNVDSGLRDPIQQQNDKSSLDGKSKRKTKSNGRIEVRIHSYRKRFLDKDNLIGGAKGLVDCLQIAGIIPDDSPEYVQLIYHQYRVTKEESRTVIEVIYP